MRVLAYQNNDIVMNLYSSKVNYNKNLHECISCTFMYNTKSSLHYKLLTNLLNHIVDDIDR